MYSVCFMSPVLIIIVWKHCRSMAHSLTFVRAEGRGKYSVGERSKMLLWTQHTDTVENTYIVGSQPSFLFNTCHLVYPFILSVLK